MSNCSNCNNEKTTPEAVPYIVHESAMARTERGAKRLWTAIILLIVLLVGSNGAWLWYESQFETVVTNTEEYKVEQNTEDGGNNSSIIENGEVVDGNTND